MRVELKLQELLIMKDALQAELFRRTSRARGHLVKQAGVIEQVSTVACAALRDSAA
jgi:hypothetical protein